MFQIDEKSAFGARALSRLNTEQVGWLTTVDEDGTPQPSPVWFLWEDETILLYSRPNQPKVTNIDRSGIAAFAFNSDDHGGNVVIFTGAAKVDDEAPAAIDHPDYLRKYAAGISSIGMTNQEFSDSYSVPIRFDPGTLRGH